jgi:hypothetical protein
VPGAIALVATTTFVACIVLGLLAEFVLAAALRSGAAGAARQARARA